MKEFNSQKVVSFIKKIGLIRDTDQKGPITITGQFLFRHTRACHMDLQFFRQTATSLSNETGDHKIPPSRVYIEATRRSMAHLRKCFGKNAFDPLQWHKSRDCSRKTSVVNFFTLYWTTLIQHYSCLVLIHMQQWRYFLNNNGVRVI